MHRPLTHGIADLDVRAAGAHKIERPGASEGTAIAFGATHQLGAVKSAQRNKTHAIEALGLAQILGLQPAIFPDKQ
jgi:hypothetical protein